MASFQLPQLPHNSRLVDECRSLWQPVIVATSHHGNRSFNVFAHRGKAQVLNECEACPKALAFSTMHGTTPPRCTHTCEMFLHGLQILMLWLFAQVEGEGVLVMPQYLSLHKALWERQQSATRRARPDQLALTEANRQVPPLSPHVHRLTRCSCLKHDSVSALTS